MDHSQTLRAAALIRMSTAQQVNSPGRQRELFADYCAQWRLQAVAECTEEAVSATHTNLAARAGITQLLVLAQQGRIDVAWCEEPSRIARKPEDWFAVRSSLAQYRVAIVGPRDDPFATRDTAIAEFTQGLQALLARYEARQLGERMHRAQRMKVAGGRFRGGRLAYGYRWVDDHFEVDPEPAATVLQIFTLYATGAGFNNIAHQLNQAGRPSPTGGKWYLSGIAYILRNPLYRGAMRFSGETYPVATPSLIPATIVAAVDARLAQSGGRPQRSSNNDTQGLFTGLLRCPECGKWLNRGTHSGRATYLCTNAKNAGFRCGWRHYIGERPLERVLLPLVMGALQSVADAAVLPDLPPAPPRDVDGERATLERERQRIIGLHVRGKISEDEADGLLDDILRRQHDLDAWVPVASAPVTLEEVQGALRTMEQHWPHMLPAERRALLQSLIMEIIPNRAALAASTIVWRT